MAVRITDEMLIACGGSAFNTLENVSRVRRILSQAGVQDVELHRLEIRQIRQLTDDVRRRRLQLAQLLESGPRPSEHTCDLSESGLVREHGDCPFGCTPGEMRIEITTPEGML